MLRWKSFSHRAMPPTTSAFSTMNTVFFWPVIYVACAPAASDAMARLRAYQRQLLAWRDIVAEGLEAGQSPEQTARRIVDSDKKLARLGRLTPLQQRHEMTLILNAVAGLAGYLD